MHAEDHDPILDAFLEEALGQTAPPDLSDRIVRAWTESSLQPSVAAESRNVDAPPTPPPYPLETVSLEPKRRQNGRKATWPRYVITLAVALAVLTIYIATINNSDRVVDNNSESRSDANPTFAQQDADAGKHDDGAKRKPNTTPNLNVADGTESKPSAFDEPAPFERGGNDTPNSNALAKRTQPRMTGDAVVSAVNHQLTQTWAVHSIEPTEQATDSEYCRRLFLAMIGRIPTVQELETFLAREDDGKRAWLVERLQTHRAYRPYYVANWTTFWTNLLIGRTGGQKESLASRAGLADYLSRSLAESKPYDQMVHELITAEGVNRPGAPNFNGAVNFLLDGYTKDATLASARTARIFLGTQIQCVQCHSHPTNEGWTQNRFWEFNAFFRQMHVKRAKGGIATLSDRSLSSESRGSNEAEIYYEELDGLKRVAFPVFFDGQAISKSGDLEQVNRRREVASFVVSSKEFSRSIVNRLWASFFQFGLSNPVDDMGEHAAPEHPEMLALMAEQFEAHDYDLDLLIRWIASTDAFGRSSKSVADNVADNPRQGLPLFSRYYTRQLSPEAVYDSLLLAGKGQQRQSGSTETVGDYVKAQRAWIGEFSKNMKTDEGQETDTFSGDIRQSVVVMTSPLMKQAVSNRLGGVLNQVTSSSMPIPKKIEHLFLAALSRKPTKKEMLAVRKIINPRDPNAGLQDIWWALLNSNEFILDH